MKTALLAAALASVLAGVAMAAPQAGTPRTRIDTNGDGAIDRTEAAAHPRLAERFDTLDANRDGRIDRAERPQRTQGHRGMSAIDTDQDGRITRAEAGVHPRLAERFDSLDANRDGVLDAGERPQHRGKGDRPKLDTDGDGRITQAEAAAHPKLKERFATLDANGNGVLDAGERPRHRGKGDRPKLDTDGDGRITQAEAAAHPRLKDRFATLDANRDGVLSREELQQARAARRPGTAPAP